MADFKDRMADYVPVNERVEAFKAAFPEGSLQSEIVELTPGRVTVKALAYRTPDDPRPGIGHSSLEIPGSTPYTRGSEIENAETSAWGRAIAALGFEVKRGLASAEEVRNKQPGRDERALVGDAPARTPAPVQRTPEEQTLRNELWDIPGMTEARGRLLADAVGVKKGTTATVDQLREMLILAVQPLPEPPEPARAHVVASADTPSSGAGTSEAATVPAEGVPPPSAAPAPEGLLDSILEVTGGELVHPQPGTDEYKALTAPEKAQARAYWQQQGVTA